MGKPCQPLQQGPEFIRYSRFACFNGMLLIAVIHENPVAEPVSFILWGFQSFRKIKKLGLMDEFFQFICLLFRERAAFNVCL